MRNRAGAGDFTAQFNYTLDNVEAALKSVGCGFENVTKISYFLSHAGYIDTAKEIFDQRMGTHTPASTGIVVDSIGGFAEAMCEMDAIAALP